MKFSIRLIVMLALVMSCIAGAYGQGTPGTVRYPANLDTADSLIRAANNARSTLASGITNSDTSVTLVSSATFPSSGVVMIDSEIIYYTGKSSNTLTGLVRGQEGSSGVSHSSGTFARGAITAGYHATLAAALIATQTKLGHTGGGPSADYQILTGNAAGQSIWSDSPFLKRLFVTGLVTAADPPSSAQTGASRLVIYDPASVNYSAIGLDASASMWFNTEVTGAYKFYFGTADPTYVGKGGIITTGSVQLGDPGTRPACSVTYRGMIYTDNGGAGVKDAVAVCSKDASDVYAWRTIY